MMLQRETAGFTSASLKNVRDDRREQFSAVDMPKAPVTCKAHGRRKCPAASYSAGVMAWNAVT
jgi:hypothetical protein